MRIARARAACGGLGMLLLLLLALAAPARAQVRPPVPLAPPQPPIVPRRPPMPNLAIESVSVQASAEGGVKQFARIGLRNNGTDPATFPAGSTVIRAEGALAFQPLITPSAYTIPPGQVHALTLLAANPCAPVAPGAVTFRVDPDNVVAETNENDNAFALAAAGFAGDLRGALSLVDRGNNAEGVVRAGTYGDLKVLVSNGGAAPIMWCPGALWRETGSPVAAKYGLRAYETKAGIQILQPGAAITTLLTPAFAPGDLRPGAYRWTVLLNPDGRMPETDLKNNAVTGNVTVVP